MAKKDKGKGESEEIKLVSLILKSVKQAIDRVDCPGGQLNIVSEMFMFGIAVLTLIDSIVEVFKEFFQSFFNMILAMNDKSIQVQESDGMLWVTVVCVVFLLIESVFCVYYVGKHMELKQKNT